jgi:hypothetical protein
LTCQFILQLNFTGKGKLSHVKSFFQLSRSSMKVVFYLLTRICFTLLEKTYNCAFSLLVHFPLSSSSNEVIFSKFPISNWVCALLKLSYTCFNATFPDFWLVGSSSIEVVFHGGCLPLRSYSIFSNFHN